MGGDRERAVLAVWKRKLWLQQIGADEVHFTAHGQIELGRLFADQLHAMMSKGEHAR